MNINGITQTEWKQLDTLLTKANNEQLDHIKTMINTMQFDRINRKIMQRLTTKIIQEDL